MYIYVQVLRAQLELQQVRQEIDRRMAEKEEEFNNSRYYIFPYYLSPHSSIDYKSYKYSTDKGRV